MILGNGDSVRILRGKSLILLTKFCGMGLKITTKELLNRGDDQEARYRIPMRGIKCIKKVPMKYLLIKIEPLSFVYLSSLVK